MCIHQDQQDGWREQCHKQTHDKRILITRSGIVVNSFTMCWQPGDLEDLRIVQWTWSSTVDNVTGTFLPAFGSQENIVVLEWCSYSWDQFLLLFYYFLYHSRNLRKTEYQCLLLVWPWLATIVTHSPNPPKKLPEIFKVVNKKKVTTCCNYCNMRYRRENLSMT